MLPISIAGWGVREATMAVAFSYAGLNQTDGTMTSLLSGATSFVVGAIGGLVWVLSREKTEKIPDVLPHVN
jgi:glycosyltransferase 2 family protein